MRNFINFLLCFCTVVLCLAVSPAKLKDLFVGFSMFLLIIKLAEWMMTRTRRYVLTKRISCKNKAVLITGCDTGFGFMLAQRLDELGYQVFAGCLNPSGTGAQELTNCSNRLHVLPLDVTSDQSVESALIFVKKNLGNNKLWAVVNNAGIAQAGEIDWSPLEDLQQVYDVNTFGTIRVTKAFLSLIKQSKGRVINNTSLCGHLACPGYIGYCMSKAAAVSFTTGLRIEMVKWGVKAISIEPFFYKTPLTQCENSFKVIDDTWNRADKDIREEYGTQYLEAFKKCTVSLLNRSSHKTDEVLYCFVDAITAAEPLSSYFPCYLGDKILLKVTALLPPVVIETYQGFQLPYFTKPAGLLKKEKHSKVCESSNGTRNGTDYKMHQNGESEIRKIQ